MIAEYKKLFATCHLTRADRELVDKLVLAVLREAATHVRIYGELYDVPGARTLANEIEEIGEGIDKW